MGQIQNVMEKFISRMFIDLIRPGSLRFASIIFLSLPLGVIHLSVIAIPVEHFHKAVIKHLSCGIAVKLLIAS